MKKIGNVVRRIISSDKFLAFYFIFFALQALYIAITYAYPMLYDEEYHYNITKAFTGHLLPLITDQQQPLDSFGALGRSPFLFYHYLLSFPLRAIMVFTDNLAINVIFLRAINIALFVTGMWFASKLLRQMGVSRSVSNVAIAVVGLLPVSSFLAATINYDNLLFPLAMYALLLTGRLVANKKDQVLVAIKLIIVLLVGLMIKISFFPIAAGILLGLFFWYITTKKKKRNTIDRLRLKLRKTPRKSLIVLAIVLCIVMVTFIERYGVNLFKYHTLSPACTTQLSVERCSNNIIERRDKTLISMKTGAPQQFPQYAINWYATMQRDSLSLNTKRVVSAPEDVDPLPVAYTITSLGIVLVLVGLILNLEGLLKRKEAKIFLLVLVFYLGALVYTNYQAYLTTHVMVGVQARYILPFMFIIAGLGLAGLNNFMKLSQSTKALIAAIVITVSVWGGFGATSYIVRSNTEWYWQNEAIRNAANQIKTTTQPYVKEWWYER